jgi:hypothetical protein
LGDVGWESDSNETIKRVEVEIHQEPTRHIVDVPKLLKWVEQTSMTPEELGIPNHAGNRENPASE